MLELLVKYAETHLDTEPGFKKERIRWAIMFDAVGQFLDVVPLDDEKEGAKPGMDFLKCPKIDSNVMRGGGKSHFLVETAGVVVLLGKESESPKTKAKHEYFVGLLRQASVAMPELTKIANLLSDDNELATVRARLQAHKAKTTDTVTLRLGSTYLVDSETLRGWWREFRESISESKAENKPRGKQAKSAELMRCFVTGELVEPLPRHPPIRGSNIGGKAETTFIGFDKQSFESYCLSESRNSAVSERAAFAYRDALNHLLENYSQGLAGAKVVHWFKDKVSQEDDPFVLLGGGEKQLKYDMAWLDKEVNEEQKERIAQHRAKQFLERICTGKRVALLDNYFYAMTLSGSGGRVMVRDWMEGQFEELAGNISCWFDDLEITSLSSRESARAPGIERVITCLLPQRKPGQDYKGWIKSVGAERVALWRAAVQGQPISHTVLLRLVLLDTKFRVCGALEEAGKSRNERAIAEAKSLLYARMGLMKAYHIRRERKRGGKEVSQDLKPFLNDEHTSPAYQCGRLMAVLADVQRAALGDVGAGVVQRYYAAASATPALVLGRLTRTSQFHLNKLEKLEPGLAHWFEGMIAGIWGRIKDTIPRTLTLEEQSLFALGYYQQMAHMRAGKTNSK